MEAIIIPKNEFADLLRDSDKLNRLECGGVDNWDWYGESINESLNGTGYETVGEFVENELLPDYEEYIEIL